MPSAKSLQSNRDRFGQGGTPLCQALAKAGWRTALVERENVGGTCINVGCTPTKNMVASGRVAYLARRGTEYGVRTGRIARHETSAARKRDIVNLFRGGSQKRMESTENLDLIFGEAKFMAAKAIQVRLKKWQRSHADADYIIHQRRLPPGRVFA